MSSSKVTQASPIILTDTHLTDPSTNTNTNTNIKAETHQTPTPEYFLRPARLSDMPTLAILNTHAYWNSPLHHRFLSPRAAEHPEDMTRGFRQKLRKKFLSTNNRTLVACPTAAPSTIVAFAQFTRLGNTAAEAAARAREEVVAGFRGGPAAVVVVRAWIIHLLAWFFWLFDRLDNAIWKDRITDHAHVKEFDAWCAIDAERYWDSHPERANRWHANSVVVAPQCQGRGIGRMLMGEVVAWAQRDNVIIGLTASPRGEHLYRKLDFEMLGDFYKRPAGGETGGGYMIRYPKPEK